jgi:hypothetical protein
MNSLFDDTLAMQLSLLQMMMMMMMMQKKLQQHWVLDGIRAWG